MAIWKSTFKKISYGKITPRNYKEARRILEAINKTSAAPFPQEEFWVMKAIFTYRNILDESEEDNELSGNIKKSISYKAKHGYFSPFLHSVLEARVYHQRKIIINKLKTARAFLKLIRIKPIENSL